MSGLKIEVEVKVEFEPCVIAWDNSTLFIGTNAGTIVTFDKNLTPGSTWPAHESQLFALTAANGKVYSSSYDGVRIWKADGNKVTCLPPTGGDVGALYVHDSQLIAGDESGNVVIYENNVEKAKYNVLEEVKDISLKPPFLFTARDLYVTVTEIKPEESRTRFTTCHTMEGRAPLKVIASRLLVTARGGNSLQLHDASIDSKFKKLHEVKVSDMILTCLTVSEDYAWTGGWDGFVRRWKITGDQLQLAGEINLGACINAIIAHGPGVVYTAISGGKVAYVKAI